MAKELVIDKNTKIDKIENKEEFTKLVINTKVNPKKLSGFTNVKDLVLDGLNMKKENVNERNLNLFPIKDNIEKLKFLNINKYGSYTSMIGSKFYYYNLSYKNLKSIEFPSQLNYLDCSNYLTQLANLEEIIFNVNERTYINENILINSTKLKKIIVKFYEKEYVVDFDYQISTISYIGFNKHNKEITIHFNNSEIKSIVTINTHNKEIKKENILVVFNVINGVLNIPGYVTNIEEQVKTGVDTLSFDLSLLNTITHKNSVINYYDNNNNVKKIILRNKNNMLLFPEKVIVTNEYGDFDKFYIENNLLKLIYPDFDLIIDNNGNVEKNLKYKKTKEIDLNNYTANELKEYMCYKMLLEIAKENDLEYKKAMEVVEDRVIKRLKK